MSPLPKFTKHPVRWTHYKVQEIGTSLVLGHIGVLAVVGLYYVLTQTIHPVTWHWNHLLTNDIRLLSTKNWSYWRHLIRNVGEGLFGVMLAQQTLWNPFKPRVQKALAKPRNWFDKLEIALKIPNLKQPGRITSWQIINSPGVALTYAIPGFVAGAFGAKGVHALAHTEHVRVVLSSHPSLLQKFYTENWDQKVVGFISGVFMARRPMKKVFNDIQHYFAERRVALGKKKLVRAYHPPAFKAVVSALAADGQAKAMAAQVKQSSWVGTLLSGSALLIATFAGFGYYVLQHFAK